jgi:arylsulfatase A-like enzyme
MPHVPLFVSDKHKGKSRAGLYGDVIEELDWSVGQILAALKEHGLEEKTLVLFASDNGPWLPYGNYAGTAGPLREAKGSTFEGGVRVPFIARWPGRIAAGRVCKEPAMTIDLLPTLARFAGAELPTNKIDGKDTSALLTDEKARAPERALYFYWGRELQAIRLGKWKLHFSHDYRTVKTPGADGKPGPTQPARIELALFDLEQDVGEKNNLADKHPEVVKQMQALADEMRKELGDSAQKIQGSGVRPAGMVKE